MNTNPFFEEKPFYLNDDKVSIKEDQVFVVLPFKNTLVFEKIIKPTLGELGLNCIKADDIFNTGTLMQDIAKSIRESAIIVVDLTGKNANVFYELGIAHAFRKRVILLTQSDEDVPSDLKAFKYYKYDVNSTAEIYKFQECLKKFKESLDSALIFDDTKNIFKITKDIGNEQQISSSFLKHTEGTFSIWVLIDNMHIDNKQGWLYIASHATNGGLKKKIEVQNPENDKENKIEIYPNVWAIRRGCPNNQVFWQFWCNDGTRELSIITTKKLDCGWHLFSILWSQEKNFIKFFINNELIETKDFKFWPKEFAEHVFIGTWPNRGRGHYFNSIIGKWRIHKSAISYEKLEKYFKESKPSN